MVVLGVEFSETVNLVGLGSLLLALAGAIYGLRYKTAHLAEHARANALEETVEDQRRRISDLIDERNRATDRVQEERGLKHEALNKLAAAEKLRDLTPILQSQRELLEVMTGLAERVVTVSERVVAMQEEGEQRYGTALKEVRELFGEHERRAQERHEAQIKALGEIAATLVNHRQEDGSS